MSIACPLDCEYLQEAHKHEKPIPIETAALPNRDVPVSEEFLQANEEFLIFLGVALARAALLTPAVIDYDIREALDATIRTHRTLQSGLLYESLPTNPLAAGLCRALQEAIAEYQKAEFENLGIHKTRDTTALGLLVFLQHFELSYNNGRRRGRAFLDALIDFYPVEPEAEPRASSSLILP